ncbi:hypothetical protein, partial [Lactococcus petauri]|uniref:hypothetical protein n=1 Tax=Lactococcus petauri TaxID=1940789 RepID=UPI0021F1C090
MNGAKVRGLAASVLTAQLVRDYFRNRQGGEELDLNTRAAGNRSINSTLNHARQLFTGRALSYKLGELQLPDLSGFL